MRTSDGFLCVYSVTDEQSFNEVRSLHDHILRLKDVESVPFVLAGNKCDLNNVREVPQEKGEALAKEWNCKFLETSAKSGINVIEIFHELVREVKEWKKTHFVETASTKSRCLLL